MTVLWSHSEAAAATGGMSACEWHATGVSIDSRANRPGDLFVAIQGPNTDGHLYVTQAMERGAVAAMVAESWAERPKGAPLLIVPDTMAGLESLARAARARSAARVVGITGSVGKTGTKDALALALAAQGTTAATQGNLNNQWGLPLSLARMAKEAVFGVFELGMNHPGEIRDLSTILRPDIAVITTVEAVHLGYFEREEEIADAKGEIFAGMGPSGAAVLNRDNRHYARLLDHARRAKIERVMSFGAHDQADVRLLDWQAEASGGRIAAEIEGERIDYRIGAAGRHWALNSLAVLATVRLLDGDVARAAGALAELGPGKGRGLKHRVETAGGAFELIDESYNANPAAMRAAIAVLGATGPAPGGRRIAVLGDMLELGENAKRLHAELAPDLVDAGVDLVFTAGADMANLAAALADPMTAGHADNSDAIIAPVLAMVRPGDVVTVKGSLGSRMTPVVDALLALALETDSGLPKAVNGN